MIDIELSPAVMKKLDRIYAYISSDLTNPKAAAETIESIIRSIERLKHFPESAPLISSLYSNAPEPFAEKRILVCGNYVAFYELCNKTVRVLQLYHASEDYIRHLFRF